MARGAFIWSATACALIGQAGIDFPGPPWHRFGRSCDKWTGTAIDLANATREKAARQVRYSAAQLLAIGIVLAPGSASADQLCGRQFDSLSQLLADIRSEADSGWRVIERSTHVIFAGGQMIWAFAQDSQPAFPAVACLKIVPGDDSIEAIVQTRCEGAKDACDAVVAKANTKDWSHLFSE
jgi:hypothetical protein